MKLELPRVINESILSEFRACRRKFYFKNLLCSTPQATSIDLHAGKCFSEGLEAAREAFFFSDKSQEEAVAIGVSRLFKTWGDPSLFSDATKNMKRMAEALIYMLTKGQPLNDEEYRPIVHAGLTEIPYPIHGIEFPFICPFPVEHPDGGYFEFSGRADQLCEYAGQLWIMDDKTTGSSFSPIWEYQFERRGQFSAYMWAAKQIGLEPAGCVVNGVSIQKTQIRTKRVIVHRPEHMVDEWLAETIKLLKFMVSYPMAIDSYAPSFGESCTNYGKKCEYLDACNHYAPLDIISMMPRSRWNPVTREVETLTNKGDLENE